MHLTLMNAVGVSDESNNPSSYKLYAPYPNPFNPSTTLRIAIDSYSMLTINILNLNGVLIEQITNQNLFPGIYDFKWQPKNISNGIYFIVIN